MKFKLKLFVTFLVLLSVTPVFAQNVPDVTQPANIVLLLMPAITWLAVEVFKKIVSLLGATMTGGWILSLVVPGLSALLSYLLTLWVPDVSFAFALILGLVSTFVDQLIKQFKK